MIPAGIENPIETERLTLRPFEAADFERYSAYHSRADVYRYLYAPVPDESALRKQYDDLLAAAFEKDGDVFRLAVLRTEDDMLLGEVVLKLANRAALQAEVGYIFNPDHGGRGYAAEATEAMITLGFEQFGFHRIFARLDADNVGSVRLVERLGLRREAHFTQNDRFDGVWGDEYVYAVLASEWNRRARSPR